MIKKSYLYKKKPQTQSCWGYRGSRRPLASGWAGGPPCTPVDMIMMILTVNQKKNSFRHIETCTRSLASLQSAGGGHWKHWTLWIVNVINLFSHVVQLTAPPGLCCEPRPEAETPDPRWSSPRSRDPLRLASLRRWWRRWRWSPCSSISPSPPRPPQPWGKRLAWEKEMLNILLTYVIVVFSF